MTLPRTIFAVFLAVLSSIILIHRVEAYAEDFRPIDPPLGSKEDWIQGVEKGDLYERLRIQLLSQIASKRSSDDKYISAKQLSKRPIKKSEVLDILKENRKKFLEKQHKNLSEKQKDDTLKLIDDGIAEMEELPNVIPPKLLRRYLKKLYRKISKVAVYVADKIELLFWGMGSLLWWIFKPIAKVFYLWGMDTYYSVAEIFHNLRKGKRKHKA